MVLTVGLTSAAVGTFAWWQRTGEAPGGSISVAKAVWLNLAILAFLVLPALAWRHPGLAARLRRPFGFVAASFAVRGAVELPLLYFTDTWHCHYGATHAALTGVTAIALWWRHRPGQLSAGDLLLVTVVALSFVEAGFAVGFCAVADPSEAWFASGDARFTTLNRLTWAVVITGYPVLLSTAWRACARQEPG